MKKILAIILLTSLSLFAQNPLKIYEKNSLDSNIIAKISNNRGMNTLRCRGADRYNNVWCKVHYRNNDFDIKGWSRKKSLDILASKPQKTFERRFGGRYSDIGKALIVLEDGFLIGGSTQSFGRGQFDAYIIKTDPYGNQLWQTTLGGNRDDSLEDIIAVKNGYIFTGSTQSFGNHMQSLYVGRITHDGFREWQKGYFLDDDDRYMGKSIAKINDTHVMIAGYEDKIKFFNSFVNCQLNAVDVNEGHRWSRKYGGNQPDKANSIIRLKDGYLFAGFTDSWGKGLLDMYVVKVDDDGKRVWHRTFGYDYNEVANQIIATKDGGFIAVGTTESNHVSAKDVYVVKMDADGKLQWQGVYGHEDDEEGFGIIEVNGGYVIAGYTKSTKQYDSQVYIMKINQKGRRIWERTYGGIHEDRAYAIAKTTDGMILTGFSKSGPQRGKDLYLLKLDENGNFFDGEKVFLE